MTVKMKVLETWSDIAGVAFDHKVLLIVDQMPREWDGIYIGDEVVYSPPKTGLCKDRLPFITRLAGAQQSSGEDGGHRFEITLGPYNRTQAQRSARSKVGLVSKDVGRLFSETTCGLTMPEVEFDPRIIRKYESAGP